MINTAGILNKSFLSMSKQSFLGECEQMGECEQSLWQCESVESTCKN